MRTRVRVKSKFKFLKILAGTLIVVILILLALQTGVEIKHKSSLWSADYAKADISQTVFKSDYTDEDYALIFNQTGLTRSGVEQLVLSGQKQKILEIQSSFFKKRSLETDQFISFTCCDSMDGFSEIIPLQNGDILVTPSTHFSFFDIGHASIVVDAENGIILNATGYDVKSCTESVLEMTCRPKLMVLRPKLSREKRAEAAAFAQKELINIQYSLSVGILSPKFKEKTDRTNCGHIVWRAYKEVGIDIDANGGALVLPADIAASQQLELLQVFGMDPREIK